MKKPSDEKDARHEFPRVSVDDACGNLKALNVRGGGRVARYAVQALRDYAIEAPGAKTPAGYLDPILKAGGKLKAARPTAFALTNGVNYALNRGVKCLESGGSMEEIRDAIVRASNDFLAYSIDAVTIIGQIGARRIKNGDTIITHSDSEAAMSIMKKAHDMGKGIRVYCTETRPNYQGHTTAAVLAAYGIDTTLICDSACRVMMGDVDKAIVGCDAISGNGALVSKIGVSQVAMLAQEARVNFIAAAETYKVDFGTLAGRLVDVEDRDPTEIATKNWMEHNPKVKFSNYVFDFTPPEYIDFYVTEKGIVPPAGFFAMMQELRDKDTAWSPQAEATEQKLPPQGTGISTTVRPPVSSGENRSSAAPRPCLPSSPAEAISQGSAIQSAIFRLDLVELVRGFPAVLHDY